MAVMLDFVDTIGTDRRLCSFNRLSGDNEPGGEMIDFHCREKMGQHGAGNNELSVASTLGVQFLSTAMPDRRSPRRARAPGHSRGAEGWAFSANQGARFARRSFFAAVAVAAGPHLRAALRTSRLP
jgi:hypothetical protein